MDSRCLIVVTVVLAGSLAAGPCFSQSSLPGSPEPIASPPVLEPHARTHQLFEDYFEEALKLDPLRATVIGDARYNDRLANNLSPAHRQERLALEKRFLAAAQAIEPEQLSPEARISHEIFLRGRRVAIESFDHPGHLMPVNQLFGLPNLMVRLGSGKSVHPFKTVKDYDDFLGRMDAFVVWVDQAIVNLREGVARKIVQPGVIVEKILPQLEAQITDDPEVSTFFSPVASMPANISGGDRRRLTVAYRAAIMKTVVPAYRKLHAFLRDEYLPAARATVGLAALPGGSEWYAYRVRLMTTTDLTPEQIHTLGLQEVGRIQAEMREVMQQVGFEGDLAAFFELLKTDPRFYFTEQEDLLDGYRSLKARVHAATPRLFAVFPKADYEIRAVEPFRERSAAGGSYISAAPDGSRPGVFFVNTFDLSARPNWSMVTLFLHEAVPGHHFQVSLQRELAELPRFRRFGSYTAYSEGWALYAETLGRELGMYEDPYQLFGTLSAELWRAIRLVVDTGLHAKGWTRQQVLDYMYANSAIKPARAVAEAERYIVAPGQALAYKIGQLKLTELRARAEKHLGEGFDIKAFHAEVLKDGALPLDVLEAKLERWMMSAEAKRVGRTSRK